MDSYASLLLVSKFVSCVLTTLMTVSADCSPTKSSLQVAVNLICHSNCAIAQLQHNILRHGGLSEVIVRWSSPRPQHDKTGKGWGREERSKTLYTTPYLALYRIQLTAHHAVLSSLQNTIAKYPTTSQSIFPATDLPTVAELPGKSPATPVGKFNPERGET